MSDEGAIPDYERDDYESGPFCLHWSITWECDFLCTCGHECKDHLHYSATHIPCGKCGCENFKDVP